VFENVPKMGKLAKAIRLRMAGIQHFALCTVSARRLVNAN
jgi:hypothetical protein